MIMGKETMHINGFLKIGTWNVQGLIKKNEDKRSNCAFMKEILDFDIVGLLETHTVDGLNDDVQIEGYHTLNFHRPKHVKAPHGSGGITILINPVILNGITTKVSQNKDHVWVKLNKNFFHLIRTGHIYMHSISSPTSLQLQ